MSQKENLIFNVSLIDLFNPLLIEARKDQSFKISDYSHSYILFLLENYAFSQEALAESEQEMLSESFLKALNLEYQKEKEKKLKWLAESVLFKISFFSSSLKRKIVGKNYYFDMGKMAYSHLYSSTKNPVHEDLYTRFSSYVELLENVGRKIKLKEDKADLIELFEWYQKTNSSQAESQLLENKIPVVQAKKVSGE